MKTVLKSLLFLAGAIVASSSNDNDLRLQHANHLFNAIHSAMRQWGSSLNHNGMTAFIATIPKGTDFYHGTFQSDHINGTEWLAFEPEHALLFTGIMHGPPPGSKPDDRIPMAGLDADLEERNVVEEQAYNRLPLSSRTKLQQVLGCIDTFPPQEDNDAPKHGYLHTYRTIDPLRLLYVDGQSAAKSTKGTLDMQDIVLLRNSLPVDRPHDPRERSPMLEKERADALCARAEKEWNQSIDGILRMEGGFEIILCSFRKHLEVVSISEAVTFSRQHSVVKGLENHTSGHSSFMLDYYKAVAARYHGIGGDRVKIDFENFVSLFAHPEAFHFNDAVLPRVRNDDEALKSVRAQIDGMASNPTTKPAYNWQAIADMLIARYADRIDFLASEELKTTSDLHSEIDNALRPFIDYARRDKDREILRCTDQFLPQISGEVPLAGLVIRNVSATICGALYQARACSARSEILRILRDTKEWLNWTVWTRCALCKINQVRLLPIWPIGSIDDFERPQCVSDVQWDTDHSPYWRDDSGHDRILRAWLRRMHNLKR